MKKNQAISYIRQLCCLGLTKETLIVELLSAVKTVIPSSGNVYVDADAKGSPCHVIPEYIIQDAIETFLDRGERLYIPDAHARLNRWYSNNRVLHDAKIIDEHFYRCDLYQLVWRPYGHYHSLQAMLKSNGGMGGLMLFRPQGSPFNDDDKHLFEYLLPYIEHGLQSPGSGATEYADTDDTGMFVMNRKGRLIFACETAHRLLSVFHRPSYPVALGQRVQIAELSPALFRLYQNLEHIFQGQDALPPTFSQITPRGRFVFRAHWLDSINGEPGALVGVTVKHLEPMALRLLRAIKELPLSPVQMEVCLLLAQNRSQDDIGRRLHIKPTTVKDHVRKIYLKLGVHQREELFTLLT